MDNSTTEDPVFMIIVIKVEDSDCDSTLDDSECVPAVKEEPPDIEDIEDLNAETLIQKLKEVGEYVSLDDDNNTPSVEPELLSDHEELIDKDACIEYELCTDEDSHGSENDQVDGYRKRALLPRCKWRSAVDRLRKRYPELATDNDALVQAVLKKMRAVTAPSVPNPYYNLLGPEKYSCIKCGKVSETEVLIGRHYMAQHWPRCLKCFACGADFRSTRILYKHEKKCAAYDARIVLQARGIFVGRKGRARPFLQSRELICQTCHAKFKFKQSLDAHERTHRGERPYQCDRCSCAYASRAAFDVHMWTHNSAFTCDHCGRTFTTRRSLVDHLLEYARRYVFCPDLHFDHCQKEKKKFKCKKCSRGYTSKKALNLHVRRDHLKTRPPPACKICSKKYSTTTYLNKHMASKHGVSILTRNMYFNRLPLMSEFEVEKAKVIYNSKNDDHIID